MATPKTDKPKPFHDEKAKEKEKLTFNQSLAPEENEKVGPKREEDETAQKKK